MKEKLKKIDRETLLSGYLCAHCGFELGHGNNGRHICVKCHGETFVISPKLTRIPGLTATKKEDVNTEQTLVEQEPDNITINEIPSLVLRRTVRDPTGERLLDIEIESKGLTSDECLKLFDHAISQQTRLNKNGK